MLIEQIFAVGFPYFRSTLKEEILFYSFTECDTNLEVGEWIMNQPRT